MFHTIDDLYTVMDKLAFLKAGILVDWRKLKQTVNN